MPIKPENRNLYPPEWPSISRAEKDAAGWRCRFCGAQHGQPNPATGAKVILTVAHLDHNPANCAPSNLRALCQRCYLRYDAAHHAHTAAVTRRQKRINGGQQELI